MSHDFFLTNPRPTHTNARPAASSVATRVWGRIRVYRHHYRTIPKPTYIVEYSIELERYAGEGGIVVAIERSDAVFALQSSVR